MASHEKFRNVAAGAQSVILAIAVVVGGAWTLYTFIWPQAQLNINIQAKQETVAGCETCVAAVVEIVNTGRRNVELDYADAPLSVRRLIFAEDGSTQVERHGVKQANYESRSRVLRSDETVRYPFLVKVPGPGVYRLEFSVPIPEREMRGHFIAGGPSGRIYWLGATHVTVVSR